MFCHITSFNLIVQSFLTKNQASNMCSIKRTPVHNGLTQRTVINVVLDFSAVYLYSLVFLVIWNIEIAFHCAYDSKNILVYFWLLFPVYFTKQNSDNDSKQKISTRKLSETNCSVKLSVWRSKPNWVKSNRVDVANAFSVSIAKWKWKNKKMFIVKTWQRLIFISILL